MSVMIYDCFPFFNELDVLEIRLNVLYDIVDYFVITEADKTHTGRHKEYIFEQNKDRFAKFLDKIIYIKVNIHLTQVSELLFGLIVRVIVRIFLIHYSIKFTDTSTEEYSN